MLQTSIQSSHSTIISARRLVIILRPSNPLELRFRPQTQFPASPLAAVSPVSSVRYASTFPSKAGASHLQQEVEKLRAEARELEHQIKEDKAKLADLKNEGEREENLRRGIIREELAEDYGILAEEERKDRDAKWATEDVQARSKWRKKIRTVRAKWRAEAAEREKVDEERQAAWRTEEMDHANLRKEKLVQERAILENVSPFLVS